MLKGNLKEVASNLNNSEKNRLESKANPKVGVKPYVPIKNKIQLMENEQVKSKNESEEFKQKHKSIMTQKLIENYENEPELSDCEPTENGKDSSNGQDCELSGNGNAPNDVPPKPLPRKSISDQGSFDENCPLTLPKPRPRTAGSNITYKVTNVAFLKFFCLFDFRVASFDFFCNFTLIFRLLFVNQHTFIGITINV